MAGVLDGKTGLETTYDYDPAGRVTLQAHPNGATTYFNYDLAGRLSEKVTVKDSDTSVLVRFAYTRDAAGNPTAIERESGLGVFYYEYDQLQRLAYEACSPAVWRGQFVDAEREYENYYEYDAAGNRTLLRHGETDADNLTYYEYDAANELTQFHDKGGWTYFAYDGNGNTVAEQTPSYTRYYDWDGINVVQEKDEAGDVTDRQVHGYAPITSVGDIAHMDKGGTPYVPVSDQVGTVWNLTDSGASVANSYQYDAYGVRRGTSETVPNRYRFGTKRLDVDSALYHFVARQYEAHRGVFLQRDPVGTMTLWSSYVYCTNQPTACTDRHGTQAERWLDCMCGPEITEALQSHFNAFIAQEQGDLNPLWFIGARELQDVARRNGWGGALGAAVRAVTERPSGSECTGSVTICGKCFAQQHIDHLLVMVYIAISYGVRAARSAGQYNKSFWFGFWHEGGDYEAGTGDVARADLAINEVGLCIAEKMKHADANRDRTDFLGWGELCDCIEAAQMDLIVKKGGSGTDYRRCWLCLAPIQVPQLELPPIDL